MDYDKLKSFVSSHKPKLAVAAVSMVMFVVGFGTGRATKPAANDGEPNPVSASQYSAKPAAKPAPPADGGAEAKTDTTKPKITPAETPAAGKPASSGKPYVAGEPCLIKGNISGKNKIYHVQGGAFYDRVTPEQCFDTESEARAAGFRKSGR